MQKIPGITREEEEQNLKETIKVAEQKVTGVRQNVAQLKKELHAMQEEFDTADKEMQALWHNTDDMFRHVSQELARAIQARKKPILEGSTSPTKRAERRSPTISGVPSSQRIRLSRW